MKTDTELKVDGYNILVENLGLVEAEKFIFLVQQEPFDYTKWRQNLWQGKTGKEISNDAMKFYKNQSDNQ